MYWKKEGRKEIQFGDTPFAVTDTKVYDCQFGDQYYKKKPVKGNDYGYKDLGKLDAELI